MYSPTTRLLAVLELLQAYPQLSGRALAKRLEVDPRTIRRYLERLQEMGIPVEAEHGPHGGYRLRRGFKIPPLMLNDGEALAITLGLMILRDLGLALDRTAVASALAKTERLMPEKLHQQVQALQSTITFDMHLYRTPAALPWVSLISQAIYRQQPVVIDYQNWDGTCHDRMVELYGIVMHQGCWYTAGFCRLRQGLRTFRLDRIQSLELAEGLFVPPPDFDTLKHVLNSLSLGKGHESVKILMQTDLETARHCCADLGGHLEASEAGVVLSLFTYNLDWVAQFLLGLTFEIEIIQPASLQQLLYQQGLKALRISGLAQANQWAPHA